MENKNSGKMWEVKIQLLKLNLYLLLVTYLQSDS